MKWKIPYIVFASKASLPPHRRCDIVHIFEDLLCEIFVLALTRRETRARLVDALDFFEVCKVFGEINISPNAGADEGVDEQANLYLVAEGDVEACFIDIDGGLEGNGCN